VIVSHCDCFTPGAFGAGMNLVVKRRLPVTSLSCVYFRPERFMHRTQQSSNLELFMVQLCMCNIVWLGLELKNLEM
jgi:hypothetical protein